MLSTKTDLNSHSSSFRKSEAQATSKYAFSSFKRAQPPPAASPEQ